MPARPRRQQRRIAFASDRAFSRLQMLTRGGRSQVDVIEEALERMPLPVTSDRARAVEDIRALLAALPKRAYPTMQELDAAEYDADGNCR
jgi:antitoxin VapB